VALARSDFTHLLEATRAGGDIDVIREGVELVLQALIEAEAAEVIGAGRYERGEGRQTQRNGYRDRLLLTKAGDVELRIPKLRQGSFFPIILERRRRVDRALYAIVMEAYVRGVSTRKVDDLVAALGGTGISKSEVSRIVASLDEEMAGFRTHRLDHLEFPYLFADATYVKGRLEHQVVSRAVVVTTGVNATGDREVLGVAVGNTETEAFWTDCFRDLRDRGLGGVRLVISDAHRGLTNAIARCFVGASWQRCRVHFMRDVLGRIPKGSQEMVLAWIRTIFAQPSPQAVRTQYDQVIDSLARELPAVAAMLAEAKEEVCTFTSFPESHWRKIWSTNPLERVNHEIKRRTKLVGVFPNDAAILRLVTAVVLEQHEEWTVAERRYLSQESTAQLGAQAHDDTTERSSGTLPGTSSPPGLPPLAEAAPAMVR